MSSKTKNLNELINHKFIKNKADIELETLHMEIIGKVLEVMNNKNMTKSELAKRIHVSKSYLSQIFAGDKIINLKSMAKIQNALNFNYIIDYIDNDHIYKSVTKTDITSIFCSSTNNHNDEKISTSQDDTLVSVKPIVNLDSTTSQYINNHVEIAS